MPTERRTDLARRVPGALLLVLAIQTLAAAPVAPQQAPEPSPGTHRHGAHPEGVDTATPLRETGNAAFGAIREVVEALAARPETDWSRVDLEALRRHLVDMHRFTLEAEVVQRESIEGGLRVVVRGTGPEASAAIRRSLEAHAPMLEAEMGWSVTVADGEAGTVLEATADTSAEAERIRGLGYIGLMASGAHHREHHWLIATGRRSHGHHH